MDHIARVGRALSYIESHLHDSISLDAVARQANSSLYWFHRLFRAVVGDSLGEYIRKRRLNTAAEELVSTRRRIIDIALDCQYSTHEAFTRAFYSHFAMTPTKYRRSGIKAIRRTAITEEFLRRERKTKGAIMNTSSISDGSIRILELPSCQMISSCGHPLDEFNAWWAELDQQRTDRFYPRDFMYFDQEREELVWLYAAPTEACLPENYSAVDFTGGLYAVSPCVDGDDVDGERVYSAICRWIDETKHVVRDECSSRPHLFHVITSDTAFQKLGYRQLDIYVPVR